MGTAEDAVSGWDVSANRLADARIRLLTGDSELLALVDQIGKTGRDMGKLWRLSRVESDELLTNWWANKTSQERFTEVARAIIAREIARMRP